MKKITVAFILGLLMFLAGCTSSQPAPKPFGQYKKLTPEEAAKIVHDAEAQQPCSERNLINATEEQKRKCDPTRGMFDNIHPKQQNQGKLAPTTKKASQTN